MPVINNFPSTAEPELATIHTGYTKNGIYTISTPSGYDGIDSLTINIEVTPPEAPTNAIVFYSRKPFTIETNNKAKNWTALYYIGIYQNTSSAWTSWNGVDVLSAVPNGDYYTLYLRGVSNTYLTGGSSSVAPNAYWVFKGSHIMCCGDLTNLLNYTATPTMGSYCFAYIFYNAYNVDFDVTLPTVTMRSNCYLYAFAGCKSMTKMPAMPATTLANNCYRNMYRDCENLIEMSELPATVLKEGCYYSMCVNCTSLINIAKLVSTTLSSQCYAYMYYGCSSLKVSTTQTTECSNLYRIPYEGNDSSTVTNALTDMFTGTGGTFTGTPSKNTDYYINGIPV